MLTDKSTERKSQPQLKKKGAALLTGYFGLRGSQKENLLFRAGLYRPQRLVSSPNTIFYNAPLIYGCPPKLWNAVFLGFSGARQEFWIYKIR